MALRISPTVVLSPLPPTILGSSDSTTSASVPSSDRSLPRMISLFSTFWTSASYSGPVGSVSGNTGAGSLPSSGGCRAENSEIRPRTLSIKLQIGDEIAQLLDRVPRHQVLALDHHQDVEFGGGKALGHLFVLAEFLGVGAEQLAQRIVDLDALEAERRDHAKQRQDDGRHNRRAQRDQAEPLEAIGQVVQLARRRARIAIGAVLLESLLDTGFPSGAAPH